MLLVVCLAVCSCNKQKKKSITPCWCDAFYIFCFERYACLSLNIKYKLLLYLKGMTVNPNYLIFSNYSSPSMFKAYIFYHDVPLNSFILLCQRISSKCECDLQTISHVFSFKPTHHVVLQAAITTARCNEPIHVLQRSTLGSHSTFSQRSRAAVRARATPQV